MFSNMSTSVNIYTLQNISCSILIAEYCMSDAIFCEPLGEQNTIFELQ